MVITSKEISKNFKEIDTKDLKQELIHLTQGRDQERLNKKVQFYQDKLAPIFEELSQRNPYPKAEEQDSLIQGVWMPIWSTIPFQDLIPGRILEQSYQIFLENGYYGNIARYAPLNQLPLLDKLDKLVVYDLLLLQKYEIKENKWFIQNVGFKQAFKLGVAPLDIEKAKNWLVKIVESKSNLTLQETEVFKLPFLKNINQKISKQLKGALKATPQFEHLYIDSDFRLVKTRREAKQRPSYTIAVRSQLK